MPTRSGAAKSLVPAARAWLLRLAFAFAWLFAVAQSASAEDALQPLPLPERSADGAAGSAFAAQITPLSQFDRETQIAAQILSGNVPGFMRRLVPVRIQGIVDGKTTFAVFFATPDYLAIGRDDDYFLTPMRPETAQRIADALECSLPTRKMVTDLHGAAGLKLTPAPIPPSSAMTNVPVFIQHNKLVGEQRAARLKDYPLGTLVAGDKKDVVLSARLAAVPGKVAIYGWHHPDGRAIQPLYTGHSSAWVDYSHGVRLVSKVVLIDDVERKLADVLADPKWSALFSDEGPISSPRYPVQPTIPVSVAKVSGAVPEPPLAPGFGEQFEEIALDRGVKVLLNSPAASAFAPGKPVKLILYALPNGNTTAQTMGRKLKPGDDWHFDIQHIAAQTRFLREALSGAPVVVAYLEAAEKSWPAWRKRNDTNSTVIPEIVETIKGRFKNHPLQVTLSGHSGGGSFIFGYLNHCDQIPNDIERIAFLDSNYAYDPALGHTDKLVYWLKASDRHFLSVLAYNDTVALLDGKPFVSAGGGTWGRSHLMLEELSHHFEFTHDIRADPQIHTALNGRIKFLLKENPRHEIFHTVQVERNGFIQSLLSGTTLDGVGYVYFGPRAYDQWIQP
jgi:hypothetical protein